jgi:transcriptional regulator with PAS, ATPase and Fis domain
MGTHLYLSKNIGAHPLQGNVSEATLLVKYPEECPCARIDQLEKAYCCFAISALRHFFIKRGSSMENTKFESESAKSVLDLVENENGSTSGFPAKTDNKNKLLEHELNNIKVELEYYQDREFQVLAMGDTILDGVFIVNGDGMIVGINNIACELLGLARSKVINKHIKNFNYLLDDNAIKKVVSKKEIASAMTTVHNKQILITGAPYFNKKGKFIHSIFCLRDMTELIKLKEDLEISEAVCQRYHDVIKYLREQVFDKNSEIIGKSVQILQMKESIIEIAKADNATVLILGETGTGKELVAKEIVKNSPRKNKPYIKINCASVPESLIESELFGYEKGSFTGALSKGKIGLFEKANFGTLLLDEIGELPVSLQSKLLRVLQEKELVRVGGTSPVKLDIRIIAATNKDLEKMIKAGKFREDLYYRINVLPIHVPPLRTRTEDIPLLANFFLKKYNAKYCRKKLLAISSISVLEQYPWHGNVRELENVIERLVILGSNNLIEEKHVLQVLHITDKTHQKKEQESLKEMVSSYERRIIADALKKYGSTHKAAKHLGMTQSGLFQKARRLGVSTQRG